MLDENFKKYVSRVEEACGEEKDIIVILKYELKDDAINKILEKGKIVKNFANAVYEILYRDKIIRVYRTGKILMKKFGSKEEAEEFLRQIIA